MALGREGRACRDRFWASHRGIREKQRIRREGYAAASRRMPPCPAKRGQSVFCLVQRRERRREKIKSFDAKGAKETKFSDRINKIYRIDLGWAREGYATVSRRIPTYASTCGTSEIPRRYR